MQLNITRKVVVTILAIAIALAAVFAFVSITHQAASDASFTAFGVQIASAFGGDGGGDGGGGGGDGGGCCGQGGEPDTGPNPGSYVEPTPPPPPPPPPPAPAAAPVCVLSASPTSFGVGGGNSVLTWTTSNATSVSINQGVGAVALSGSQNVAVVASITYTLTATGPGGSVNCSAPISVAVASAPACDSFTASPTNLPVGGGSVTLTWATTNVTSVSINQGVGAQSAVDGSVVVNNVNSSRTFTLTATGTGGTVTCQAPVTVPLPSGLACDSFSASPNSFGVGGGNTTLTWATTGATSVSIDQGIGSVSADGSQTVAVSSSRTFTLTATDGTNTITCPAPVTVDTPGGGGGGGGGGGSSAPRCEEFRASDTNIDEGDTITLSWETNRGTRLEINPDVLETRDDDLIDEGDIRVKPNKTTKYTLTVYKGSRKDTCSLTVRVDDIEIADAQPITSISFREIPYTGFEAGPALTSLFYALLALWSAAVAYILVIKRESVFGFSLPARQYASNASAFMPRQEYHFGSQQEETSAVSAAVATPVNLPVAATFTNMWKTVAEAPVVESHSTSEDLMTRLENDAHTQNILLSSDAMRAIVDHGETPADAIELLSVLIERAKASFPREDGWIVLNRERVMGLLS